MPVVCVSHTAEYKYGISLRSGVQESAAGGLDGGIVQLFSLGQKRLGIRPVCQIGSSSPYSIPKAGAVAKSVRGSETMDRMRQTGTIAQTALLSLWWAQNRRCPVPQYGTRLGVR